MAAHELSPTPNEYQTGEIDSREIADAGDGPVAVAYLKEGHMIYGRYASIKEVPKSLLKFIIPSGEDNDAGNS